MNGEARKGEVRIQHVHLIDLTCEERVKDDIHTTLVSARAEDLCTQQTSWADLLGRSQNGKEDESGGLCADDERRKFSITIYLAI